MAPEVRTRRLSLTRPAAEYTNSGFSCLARQRDAKHDINHISKDSCVSAGQAWAGPTQQGAYENVRSAAGGHLKSGTPTDLGPERSSMICRIPSGTDVRKIWRNVSSVVEDGFVDSLQLGAVPWPLCRIGSWSAPSTSSEQG